MVFIKKVNNSDPGDADHWGGDDIDRLDDYFADVDITGPALINTETKIRKDKLKIGDTSNDHFVTISNSEQAANRTATIPILAGSDDFVFAAETQTLTNKTINASNNTISNIGTSAISNDAVTFAKMQNIATDRLLGRDTAASGDPEELTVSGGIEFTGSGGIQTSAFTGDVTKSAGGTATTIANDAVTNAKMANMAANTIKGNNTSGAADPSDISIGTNTVLGRVAGDIVAAQLATGQIADDAVTYAKIQDVSNTDRLLGRDTAAAGVVEELSVSGGIEFTGSGGIQTSAFTGDVTKSAGGTALTIANDSVTYAKMQNVVNDDRFLGRISGAGGDVEELTGTQATTLLDVFTDALKGLAPASGGGTTTYLRADGTWQTPPGGGGGDNITVNAVAVTDADFDDATPAASADHVNVKWQKDAGTPNNISAQVQPASGAQGGIVTTGTQTMAGAKTFSGNVTTNADLTAAGATLRTGIISPTTTGKNNDYNPTNLSTTYEIRWNGADYCGLTGLAGGASGREILLTNVTTDYLLWLENENTASSASNRFSLPHGFPAFLMPGDSIELRYDGTASRWRVKSWPNQGQVMGLPFFSDFVCGTNEIYTSVVNGTGAGISQGTADINTTERSQGIVLLSTGTTTTGRSSLGANSSSIVPTLAPALYVSRQSITNATDGTQTFSILTGFQDASGGTFNDGVAWEYRWNGSAAEWSQTRSAAGTPSRTTTGSPSTGTTQIWTVVFVNSNWTRADFIYSDDSVSFSLASSPTTGFPTNAQYAGMGISIIKSAGTTSRTVYIDFIGYRSMYVRG